MSPGRSVFHAEWRKNSQGLPIVRIATLGPTAQDSHFEQAKFPPQFIEAYARSRGLNQTIRGYDGTADYAPIAKIDFVTSSTFFKNIIPPTGKETTEYSGFDICIRDVDYKPLKKP
jgi:hypothetical protein